tara:strand:- start:414 stop:584 length:171 start_codon:yes stop_codon:yes gene_type:complete
MAKIKIICDHCKGNGYLKVNTDSHSEVHQCPTCHSEGEIIVANDQVTVADLKETIQ